MQIVGFPREALTKCLKFLLVLFCLSGCLSRMEEITESTRDQVKDSNEKMSDLQKGTQILESIGQMAEDDDNIRATALTRLLNLYDDERRLGEIFGMLGPLNYPTFEKVFTTSKTFAEGMKILPNVMMVERPKAIRYRFDGTTLLAETDSPEEPTAADLLMVNPVRIEFFHTAWRSAAKFFSTYGDIAHRGGLNPKDKEDLLKIAPKVLRLGSAVFGAAFVDDAMKYAEDEAAVLKRVRPLALRKQMARYMTNFIYRLGIKDAELDTQTHDYIRERMEVDVDVEAPST